MKPALAPKLTDLLDHTLLFKNMVSCFLGLQELYIKVCDVATKCGSMVTVGRIKQKGRAVNNTLDGRIHVIRDDAASENLRNIVSRSKYLAPSERHLIEPMVPILAQPSPNAARLTELLYGDEVDVYEEVVGWAWVQRRKDRYVGYCKSDSLSQMAKPNCIITAPLVHAYAEPNFTKTPISKLYCGSEVRITRKLPSERPSQPVIEFGYIEGMGWIETSHASQIRLKLPEALLVVKKFVGTPYLWGGRTYDGIDCSGLSQLLYHLMGVSIPRDTDHQQGSSQFGSITGFSLSETRAGDLLFFPGHVVIVTEPGRCVHAQARTMCVKEEALKDVLSRREQGMKMDDVTLKRLSGAV